MSQPKVRLNEAQMTTPSSIPGGPRAERPKEMPACSPSRKSAGTMSNISFILSLLYLLFLAADGQHLRGVGGNNLVLGVGSDDLDGDVFEPGKEDSLPQVVLAAAFGHPVEEGRRVVGLHHPPRLVDDQQALFEVLAHRVPDVVGYQVHRHRLY